MWMGLFDSKNFERLEDVKHLALARHADRLDAKNILDGWEHKYVLRNKWNKQLLHLKK